MLTGFNALVVDDDDSIRSLAVKVLARLGVRSDVADNGLEALGRLDMRSYDLVLMDQHMPEMDGLEATMAVRRRESQTGRHLPIIAMTADSAVARRGWCAEHGMDSCVPKPFDLAQFAATVTAILESARTSEAGAASEQGASAGAGPGEGARAPADASVFDRKAFIAKLDGDERLGADLLSVFVDDSGPIRIGMSLAAKSGDMNTLVRLSHTITGSATTICAQALASVAAELEEAGHTGDPGLVAGVLSRMEQEWDRLARALAT